MAIQEQALVVAAQQGDLSAFNQLVLAYQGLAYSVAYGILGEPDGAVDATQESFIKAYRAVNRFKGGSFKAWLMRIVTNTCYDQIRRRQRLAKRQTSLDALPVETDHVAYFSTGRSPQEHAELQELRQTIQRGLRVLPEDQRTALVLCDLEGFSYEEIARITGAAVGTVKSRLSRARARLRDYLVSQRDTVPHSYVAAHIDARCPNLPAA